MAEVGRTVPNTIGKAPITFAMIETADSADCNARKSQWLSYGFKDITPTFGSQSTVPSLNDSMVSQGRQMLEAMKSVNADWYMISGHHGVIYTSEYMNYLGADQDVDFTACANGAPYCGFFNEAYHAGRWMWASQSDPDAQNYATPPANLAQNEANEIYLRTTDAAPDSAAKQNQDNPVFDSASSSPAPKGIIISACRTLFYLSARKTWSSYFPNAVIIGTNDRIVSGTWVSSAIAAAQMTNESFWRDPQSILDQDGMCTQLEQQLTANFPSSSEIAVVYKGTLYRKGKSQPVGDTY